jgi:glutamyl-tRNA reductase
MGYVVVGLSHRTTPVELRERFAIEPGDLPDALAALRQIAGVGEGAVLSTCNRTEIYAEVEDTLRDGARLSAYLADLAKTPLAELETHLYLHDGRAAVRHVFRVAASLDSMVLGESQVLGQLKAAFAAARASETAGPRLGRLMDAAFAAAKRVRTETRIGGASLSVGGAAVDLARNIFGDLSDLSVLLVGAGDTGRLTLEHLRQAGVQDVFVANRTVERAAAALAELQVKGFPVALDQAVEIMARVDIVVSAIEAADYLLDRHQAEALLRRRRGRPLFLIDISVPRSLDPGAHEVEGVFLYDIDDLEGVVAGNQKARHAEASVAERLVDGEVSSFLRALSERDVAPAVKALLDRLEAIRKNEVERHLGARADLTPEARAAVESATRAMMSKIAHGPIRELKRAAGEPRGVGTIEALLRALVEEGEREAARGRRAKPPCGDGER